MYTIFISPKDMDWRKVMIITNQIAVELVSRPCPVFINHSQEYSVFFSKIVEVECHTTADWLNRIVMFHSNVVK